MGWIVDISTMRHMYQVCQTLDYISYHGRRITFKSKSWAYQANKAAKEFHPCSIPGRASRRRTIDGNHKWDRSPFSVLTASCLDPRNASTAIRVVAQAHEQLPASSVWYLRKGGEAGQLGDTWFRFLKQDYIFTWAGHADLSRSILFSTHHFSVGDLSFNFLMEAVGAGLLGGSADARYGNPTSL